jgi:hypothetical protein
MSSTNVSHQPASRIISPVAWVFWLACVFMLVTRFLRWDMILLVAFIAGISDHGIKRPAAYAALASGLAWGMWLAIDAIRGIPVLTVATQLANIMALPTIALFVVTMCFVALAVYCTTTIGVCVRRLLLS